MTTVVMTEASKKYRINMGNTDLADTFTPLFPPAFSAWRTRKRASARVMGMMARVRVSLTMVAYSSTAPLVP